MLREATTGALQMPRTRRVLLDGLERLIPLEYR
jgi:hypothetical protein